MSTTNRVVLSNDQLLEAVKKKRDCNAKAQAVVEALLERHNEVSAFFSQLQHINQFHYDDIVDERHILQLCGYPLCARNLDIVPTKKYQISTMANKVYDITVRKKFCSTQCFKASEYIKAQILTSPLWLRHQEILPKFTLLIDEKDDNRGSDNDPENADNLDNI